MRKIASLAFLSACAVWAQPEPISESVHYIRPGQDPQAVLDRASPGDRLVFTPGLHEHSLNKHQSILYVEKAIDIELQAGAVLKLAEGQTTLEYEPELTVDHGAVKTLDDFSAGGHYDGGLGPVIYTIRIDGEGREGRADTFSWVTGWGPGATRGTTESKVVITGDWQTLSHGVAIKFDSRFGHSVGSFWALSYDGSESYGIRVGRGIQSEYIENVRIFGRGTIDLNQEANVQPSELVKDISACVLIHGRVRNVSVEQITMANSMRSVMAYGEHTGKFLRGGGTEGGESHDAENIAVIGTRTINPKGRGYLFGHPSHRGRISKVRCNYNYMETLATSIEPNFRLDQYEVIGNVIKSDGRAIHCWRKSSNGIIKNNVRIDDQTGQEVVMVNSPDAWEDPENLLIRDNRNHLSDRIGRWATVSGGLDNHADGDFAVVSGGLRNRAESPFSRVHGVEGRSIRAAEDVLAGGAFDEPGDAQAVRLVAKAVTTDHTSVALRLADGGPLTVAEHTATHYRIFVVARDRTGAVGAAFEANGVVSRNEGSNVLAAGAEVTARHKTHAGLNFEILPDAEHGVLEMRARGIAGTTVRWVADVTMVEVKFE